MTTQRKHELTQLAIDLCEGRVFTDRHIPDSEPVARLQSVFMCFAFADDEFWKAWDKEPALLVYEYLEKAGSYTVNNLPTFFSMRMIRKQEEFDYLLNKQEELILARESVVGMEDC